MKETQKKQNYKSITNVGKSKQNKRKTVDQTQDQISCKKTMKKINNRKPINILVKYIQTNITQQNKKTKKQNKKQ